ncbi:hypothetical protein [Polyangium mundeleinium]|uniref:Uncharacterized protein n=1 Tax=Polyangium mundeleinium TaxID=2995306 RepID=A0ABT5F780_9BACT|nr:hypothetical protein [Polyangium mundeleinium]MDC0749961.1 hypothetical protein [Polyangium mundeleinium]
MVVLKAEPIITVIALIRPADSVPLLSPAAGIFERLLGELLLRGSSDPNTDIERLKAELKMPGVRECASFFVYEEEFGRIVATVAYYGPGPVDADVVKSLWPVAGPEQATLVAQMVEVIQRALPVLALSEGGEGLRRLLIDADRGWSVAAGYTPPPRKRGRPADVVQQSVLVLGVREEIFAEGARPYEEVATTIAVVSKTEATKESIYRLMKKAREKVPDVPEGWKDTLLCERISPLHSDMFRASAPGADPPLLANKKRGLWPRLPR